MICKDLFIDGIPLPEPLKKERMYELLQLAQNGSLVARDKLVYHNIRLIVYLINRNYQCAGYYKDDLVSVGSIGLMKAIDNYNITKGFSFITYATKCINNEIIMFLRKLQKHQNVDSIDRNIYLGEDNDKYELIDVLIDDTNIEEEITNKEVYKIIRQIVQTLSDRDKEIVILYFGFYNNYSYTQKEIADKLNISQSRVCRLLKIVLENIKSQLEFMNVIEPKTKKH